MGDSIKSSDLARQLKNADRYVFSEEELRDAELRLDLLDGTRDGQVDLDRVSRETVAGEICKIISAKADPVRGAIWCDAEEIAGILTRAETAGKESAAWEEKAAAEDAANKAPIDVPANERDIPDITRIHAVAAGMVSVVSLAMVVIMANVAKQAAELGAAAAVGVGLGAAVVYSGVGEVLPVAPFVTFKQAGDWLGEGAYRLTHSE